MAALNMVFELYHSYRCMLSLITSLTDDDWCFIKERASSNSPNWTTVFWSIFSFYFWLYLNVLVYIVLLVMAMRHIYKMRRGLNRESITLEKMQKSLKKLVWYPLITLIVWLPAALYDVAELSEKNDDDSRYSSNSSQYFAYLLPTTHGILICIVYFATNIDMKLVLQEVCSGKGLPNSPLLESLTSSERNSNNLQISMTKDADETQLSYPTANRMSEIASVSYSESSAANSKTTAQSKNVFGWAGGNDDMDDDNYV